MILYDSIIFYMLTKAPEQFLSNFDVAGGLQCQKCISSCSILRASGNFWLSSRTWKDALTWFRTDMDRLKIFENVWNCLGCERNGTELKNNKDIRRFFVHVVICNLLPWAGHGQGWPLWCRYALVLMNPNEPNPHVCPVLQLEMVGSTFRSFRFKMIQNDKMIQDISRYFKIFQDDSSMAPDLDMSGQLSYGFVMVCHGLLLYVIVFTFLLKKYQEGSKLLEHVGGVWGVQHNATQHNMHSIAKLNAMCAQGAWLFSRIRLGLTLPVACKGSWVLCRKTC